MSIFRSNNESIDLYSVSHVSVIKCNDPCQGGFQALCTSLNKQLQILQTCENNTRKSENSFTLCTERVTNECEQDIVKRNTDKKREINGEYLRELEKRIKTLEKRLHVYPVSEEIKNAEKSDDSATQPEPPYKFIFNRRAVIITGSVILLIILTGIIVITINGLTKQTIRKKPMEDSDYIFNGTLLIVSRDEWFAEAVHEDIERLKLPVPRVIIAHTASTTCENKFQCDARVQSVQAFHMHSNGWGDIGYNFLVGGNGLVYEGRGWYTVGAHTKGYNRGSIGIAFIGTFTEEVPTENDLKAAKLLIEEGVRLGVLAQDYRLYGARQLSGTESPGKALYSIITKWPHWSRRI